MVLVYAEGNGGFSYMIYLKDYFVNANTLFA